jgi:hypothetical protein
VTLYSAFINPDHITPFGSTLPAIFAKSSMVWSTIFFIISNKNIKSKMNLIKFLSRKKKTSTIMEMYFVQTNISNRRLIKDLNT